jgi:hypothetical protein
MFKMTLPKECAIFSYDTSLYPFKRLIKKALQVPKSDLEDLKDEHFQKQITTQAKDQSSVYHKKFYENRVSSGFMSLYEKFLKEIIKPDFAFKEMVYQTVPTFRIAYQGNMAVGEWHRDTDYGHSLKEINIWLPVTKTYKSNTIFVEGRNIDMEYGQYLVFDGSRLHGNIPNCEGWTRVSFDFRIMDYKNYTASDRVSISAGKKFIIGDYFSVI